MRQVLCILAGLAGCSIGNEPVYDELPIDQNATSARQATEVVPSKAISDIDWSLALEAERLPQDIDLPEELDLPVLLVDAPIVSFVSGEHWYTASYRFSDHNVVVEGTRIIFDDPLPEGVTEPTRATPRSSIIHHIVDATFVAWGASYTVSMECNNPGTNPKCANDKAIKKVIKELQLADSPALLREAQ
jgi:hypothetical protein